jgi:hypothetical protein
VRPGPEELAVQQILLLLRQPLSNPGGGLHQFFVSLLADCRKCGRGAGPWYACILNDVSIKAE